MTREHLLVLKSIHPVRVLIFGALLLVAACSSNTATSNRSRCGSALCPPSSRSVDERLGVGAPAIQMLVEPGDGVTEVAKAIDGAQHTILVSAYILSQHRIVRALERAAAQGVGVYVLLERHPYGIVDQPQTMFAELAAAGVHIEWAPDYFVYSHAKFMVLDDAVLVVSSANFSESGFTSDRDFVVIDDDALDVREADNIFRADWDRIAPVLNDPDLLVSPSNSRGKLSQLLARAHHSIDLYSEEVLDPAMVNLLAAKARAGIRVRVLAATVSNWARRVLTRAGARIGTSGYRRLYIHAKAIVVDDRLAFVGSENLSTTSLNDNRELGLLVEDRSAVNRIEATFDRDWRG